jgi:UPF0755 protein
MTEYGLGAGSEAWYPEDPLYGDQRGGGQQDSGQTQYDGGQQYPQGQQQYDQYGNLVYPQPQGPYQQQAYPQGWGQRDQVYPQTRQQYPPGQQYPQGQQYPPGQTYPPSQTYQGGQESYAPQQYPYVQQPPSGPRSLYHDAGTGGQPATPYGAPSDPHAIQQAGYGDENGPAQENPAYRTTDGYPPPQPLDRSGEWQQAPAGPEPEPEPETHPFFTGIDCPGDTDDRDDDDPGGTREGARGRLGKTKPKKRRSGFTCFMMAVVLGGGGYFAYGYWQSRNAPPPDFSGVGSEPVQVVVPDGTSVGGIGRLLKRNGVVKSVDAFVLAAKGKPVQAGVYSLNHRMSAANAVAAMNGGKNLNVLIVPPGTRDRQVYAGIDAKLKLKAGTTQAIAKAKAEQLGLPSWAKGHKDLKDPLEGFLYPASYPVSDGMKPEDILKKMVGRADEEYGKQDLAGAAKKLGLKDPFQVITVASLVQAEGKYKHDFTKVARVVYNRLEPQNLETVGRLELDSTINYVRAQSTLNVGSVDALRKINDPYNTYNIRGLPPGPIGNPGIDALYSAMHPASGPWYYFVSVTADKTVFAVTNAEQNRNREKYRKQQE